MQRRRGTAGLQLAAALRHFHARSLRALGARRAPGDGLAEQEGSASGPPGGRFARGAVVRSEGLGLAGEGRHARTQGLSQTRAARRRRSGRPRPRRGAGGGKRARRGLGISGRGWAEPNAVWP